VQRQGEVHSAARATDQSQIADLWAAPIQNYWNEIAPTAALELLGSGERRVCRIYAGRPARLGQTPPGIARAVTCVCSATTFNLAER
jgi:hypothetical protein